MARIDYKTRLSNLKFRKTDPMLNKALVSESFGDRELPETVRYVFDAMKEIDREYTKKTYEEASRVQNQMDKSLDLGQEIEYQYQGSVPLNTHILVHSDLDILSIYKEFHGLEYPLQATNPYQGDPVAELRSLRTKIYNQLNRAFPAAKIDNTSSKAVSISGGSLARKFDIIVCNWYETVEYQQAYFKTNSKRGIQIYDKDKNNRFIDFPFSHIEKVEEKNKVSRNENFKRLIRLLKNLKFDAVPKIDLSSFMITSVMYHMDDLQYLSDFQNSTTLLIRASEHLKKVIFNASYRAVLESPNRRERLFAEDSEKKIAEFKRLKKELDDTIEDLAEELRPGIKRLNENYHRIGVENYYEPLEKASINYRL